MSSGNNDDGPPTYHEATDGNISADYLTDKKLYPPIASEVDSIKFSSRSIPSSSRRLSHSNSFIETAPRQTTDVSHEDLNGEDYHLLGEVDTIFLIDDSSSMRPHWEATRIAVESIIDVRHKYDKDGVDLRFLNNSIKRKINPGIVNSLFNMVKPEGVIPTAAALGKILWPYTRQQFVPFMRFEKPLNIIVFTDGRPYPEPEEDTINVITKIARWLNFSRCARWQVGNQLHSSRSCFVQHRENLQVP